MDARLSRQRTSRSLAGRLVPAMLLAAALVPSVSSAQGTGADTLVLNWTAPGDDGSVGTAHHYEVRMSTSSISNSNWSSARLIGGAPAPLASGQRQQMIVRGLSRDTTYFFAVKTVDDADNVSDISNVVRWDWVFDTAPPSAPAGVTAVVEGGTDVRVRWSANGEPDLSGYTVYRRESANGSATALNSSLISGTQFVDATIPAGTTQVWYQISATDQSGNESARSAAVIVTLGEAAGEFALHAVFPNPSRGSESVNIPMDLPLSGANGAVLHVYDKGSRLVRVLPIPGLGGGPAVVVWDGRNDAGVLTAPGVYIVRLKGTGGHRMTKVVRLP